MTHSATPPLSRSVRGFANTVRALPHAAFAIVIAAVVFCSAGLANVPSSWLQATADSAQTVQDADSEESAAEVAAPAPQPLTAPRPDQRASRCPGCGVVESIRRLEPVGNLPAAFEFTVRLRDGTRRVSHSAGQGSWRAGDRIMLMGGATASSL